MSSWLDEWSQHCNVLCCQTFKMKQVRLLLSSNASSLHFHSWELVLLSVNRLMAVHQHLYSPLPGPQLDSISCPLCHWEHVPEWQLRQRGQMAVCPCWAWPPQSAGLSPLLLSPLCRLNTDDDEDLGMAEQQFGRSSGPQDDQAKERNPMHLFTFPGLPTWARNSFSLCWADIY